MFGIIARYHRYHRPRRVDESVTQSDLRNLETGTLTFDTIWAIKLSGSNISEAPPGRSAAMLASNMFWLTAAMMRHLARGTASTGKIDEGAGAFPKASSSLGERSLESSSEQKVPERPQWHSQE